MRAKRQRRAELAEGGLGRKKRRGAPNTLGRSARIARRIFFVLAGSLLTGYSKNKLQRNRTGLEPDRSTQHCSESNLPSIFSFSLFSGTCALGLAKIILFPELYISTETVHMVRIILLVLCC